MEAQKILEQILEREKNKTIRTDGNHKDIYAIVIQEAMDNGLPYPLIERAVSETSIISYAKDGVDHRGTKYFDQNSADLVLLDVFKWIQLNKRN